MKQKYYKSVATYVTSVNTQTSVFYECITHENGRKFINTVTADGKVPEISGEDSYCAAIAAVIRVHGENGQHHCVETVEIKWKDLPDNIKQIFNYVKYIKEIILDNESKNN